MTLQENNAIAVLDLQTLAFTRILPLGHKDHSLPGNALDPSDRDGGILIANWPVFGMYQPDSVTSYTVTGKTYHVTANEGDARDYEGFAEEARVSTLALWQRSQRHDNALRHRDHPVIGLYPSDACRVRAVTPRR